MRKMIPFFLTLFLVGCSTLNNIPGPVTSPEVPNKPYYGECGPILRIETQSTYRGIKVLGRGTAFLVEYKGSPVLLTAHHVMEDVTAYSFFTPDRKYVDVVVERILLMKGVDAAILFVSYISAKIKPLQFADVSLGEPIELVGFPGGEEKTTYKGRTRSSFIETSAFVKHGMSGGPVLKDGKVVGLISSKLLGRDKENLHSQISRISEIFKICEAYQK